MVEHLDTELFQIKKNDLVMVYAPLSGSLFSLSADEHNELSDVLAGREPSMDLRTKLRSMRVLRDEPIPDLKKQLKNDFFPTAVTLFPTSRCNLECIYCYATAGVEIYDMDFETARTAVDIVHDNLKKIGKETFSLTFHGGGEPLTHFGFVKEISEYVKSFGMDTRLSSATNGCLNDKQLAWIIQNNVNLTFSLDGPREIQEKQRPTKNGRSSYDWAMNSVKELTGKVNFGFRPTITKASVEILPEMVEFFYNLNSSKKLHVEPMSDCGRCADTHATGPNPMRFVEKYLEAKQVAQKLGINLYCAEDNIGKGGPYFCGALGQNFAVTPQGYLSSCYEATKPSDETSKNFFYGKIENGNIAVNEEKLGELRSRSLDNIEHCTDCFLKYDCKGGCPAKNIDMFQPDTDTCEITQELGKVNLYNKLVNQDG